MLSKEKVLYQVKLILDYLPQEEYKLIPQDAIDYIEDNCEYDENITINPQIPLDKQNVDKNTYKILNKIIKNVSKNNTNKLYDSKKVHQYINNVKKSNQDFEMKVENLKLKRIIESLKKENSKVPKVKELLKEYKKILIQKDNEIIKLKEDNQNLSENFNKIPRVIRNIFV